MQRDQSLGSGDKKDVCIYPGVENLFQENAGRGINSSMLSSEFGTPFLGHQKRTFYECYSLRCGVFL